MSREDREELIELSSILTKMKNESLDALDSDDVEVEYHQGVYDTAVIALHQIDKYLFRDHDDLFNFLLGDN